MKAIFKWILICACVIGCGFWVALWVDIKLYLDQKKLVGVYEVAIDPMCIVGPGGGVCILPSIVDYHFDDNYIVARQLPFFVRKDENVYSKGYDCAYYWLIEVADTTTFGPFTREQFDSLLARKKIPKELHLY